MLWSLFLDLGLSDIIAYKELSVPELDVLSTFYEKICITLPVNELLPKLVAERVITVTEKAKISATGKTEFERSQYLLDYYIARPLSVGDSSFFNKLLDLMSTSSKCNFLINEIQCQLSTTRKNQKFSGECIQYKASYFSFVHSEELITIVKWQIRTYLCI